MTYNQEKTQGIPMPLLVGCTKTTVSELIPGTEKPLIYDPINQIVVLGMAIHNTRSERILGTPQKPGLAKRSDKKNINDDKKSY